MHKTPALKHPRSRKRACTATQRAISTLGRIDSITTGLPPSSITTRYGFDANGQSISNTDGLNQSTQASLDGLGRPSATTFADTTQARQAYNQLSQITQVTDPKGISTRYTQNAWGETLTETSPDSGTVTYTRDGAGNVTSKTDARGQTTRYSYDDLYRITQIVQADGKQQSFAYDGTAAGAQTGYLREVQDASGSTRYTRDPFGRITSKTQTVLPLATAAANATMNPAATAASTLVTRYSYTSAGQLAQISYPSGLAVSYKRNATGQISGIDTQESGRNKPVLPFVSALAYNALQLPTAWQWQHCTTKNGTPAATCTSAQRSYDSAARMSSNELASYGYDVASRITSLTQNLYSRALNQGNSGQANTLQQTPITWQIAYDNRGRVTRFERSHAQTSYSYDANSNRISSTARSSGAIDLDDNFDQPDRALSIAQAYNVEASSNRLLGFSQTTSTSKGTRTVSTVSASVNYPLDQAGNITSDGLRSFGYDANNRHSQTTLAGAGISATDVPRISYLHNAFGQRVFKSEPISPRLSRPDPATNSPGFAAWLRANFPWMYDGEGEDEAGEDDKKDKNKDNDKNTSLLGHSYVYDDALGGANTLLGEYGNGGASSTGTTEYLWLPTDAGQTIPVGLYRHGKLYAVHSDHLDTPRLITDDSNQPVWQWPYSAFGDNLPTGVLKAKKVEGEGNDSEREREGSRVTSTPSVTATVQLKATDPAITLNLRFAGQYRDSETGLFYNGMRTYAPQLGAYTQMDPIGLSGGLNRRGYVEGSPLMFVDPRGLDNPRIGPYGPGPNVGDGSSAVAQAAGAMRDFLRNYDNMRSANTIGGDKYFHCMANCEATRRGPMGETTACLISDVREWTDQNIKGDSASASLADQVANAIGRSGALSSSQSCRAVCSGFRPNGLPSIY
jgi:RHS repeat-associated protein